LTLGDGVVAAEDDVVVTQALFGELDDRWLPKGRVEIDVLEAPLVFLFFPGGFVSRYRA
jgi:hypothetical protein